MKNFSEHHTVIDSENIMLMHVENQIFVIGENIKMNNKVYKILEIISPVIRLRVQEEIKHNG
jgi:hypothetical protein